MSKPPGPRGLEVLGFFQRTPEKNTLTFLEGCARRYGPISSFRLLHKHVYLVDDADLIKEVLITQQHSFERDTGATLLRELLGDSLITREEPKHRERRRVLQPAFHREQIAYYGEIMSEEIARFAGEWRDGSRVDIRQEMRRLTLAIAGSALFGADFLESADKVAAVLQSVTEKSRVVVPLLLFLEPLFKRYRRWFPNGPSPLFQRERRVLRETIAPILRERRGSGTKDILSLILNSRNEEDAPLTDIELSNEIVTFILAGHETTATALSWTWYLLARNPEAAERMRREIAEVLGERIATMADLPHLAYTAAVFQEGLRLYPPALAFARRTLEPVSLGGFAVPKGASVFVSPYITQRNARYFREPEVFQPERWLEGAPPKFAYFPFGAGAKMCIGEPFARLEGVLALAELGRRWHITCSNKESIRIGAGMLLRPSTPILLDVAENSRSCVSRLGTRS